MHNRAAVASLIVLVIIALFVTIAPVSYTHLDVYKRQAHCDSTVV